MEETKAVEEKPKEEVVQEEKAEAKKGDTFTGSDTIALSKIAEELNVDSLTTTKNNFDLERLLKYAQQRGATDINEILWEIRDLANKVGNSLTENKLKRMARFAFLFGERRSIDKEIEQLKDEH